MRENQLGKNCTQFSDEPICVVAFFSLEERNFWSWYDAFPGNRVTLGPRRSVAKVKDW